MSEEPTEGPDEATKADPRTSIAIYAADLREDAKAADVFGSMADDANETRAAAFLRGLSEGLRLAAMRTWNVNPDDPNA